MTPARLAQIKTAVREVRLYLTQGEYGAVVTECVEEIERLQLQLGVSETELEKTQWSLCKQADKRQTAEQENARLAQELADSKTMQLAWRVKAQGHEQELAECEERCLFGSDQVRETSYRNQQLETLLASTRAELEKAKTTVESALDELAAMNQRRKDVLESNTRLTAELQVSNEAAQFYVQKAADAEILLKDTRSELTRMRQALQQILEAQTHRNICNSGELRTMLEAALGTVSKEEEKKEERA